MLHHLHAATRPDRTVCKGSADRGSIVDRLLAVAELPETGNEIDRAIVQHRQLTLARTIKGLIDGDDRGCEAA